MSDAGTQPLCHSDKPMEINKSQRLPVRIKGVSREEKGEEEEIFRKMDRRSDSKTYTRVPQEVPRTRGFPGQTEF